MSYTRRSRYSSRSPSPYNRSRYSRSLSLTPSRSRSRSRCCYFTDATNPGNNLYVTGLSSQISKVELEDHFASEGKVADIHLVVDPYTRESRGFGFVTMGSIEEAERCIKYLDGSILDGRVISVEKAKRGRGRTPTPGRYLGLRTIPPARRRRSSSSSDRERSYSPYYYRRSRSPYRRSPIRRRRYHSSMDSRSPSPRLGRRRSRRRSYSTSISPAVRRRSRRRSYSRSISPRRRRSFPRKSRGAGDLHRHTASSSKKRYSRESYSHSRSVSSSHSRSVSSSSVR